MKNPNNLTGVPSYSNQQQPQRARIVDIPPPHKAPSKKTHQKEALITVRLPNRVALNMEAASRLIGDRVEVEPPRTGRTTWVLVTGSSTYAQMKPDKGVFKFTSNRWFNPKYFYFTGTAPISPTPRGKLVFRLGSELVDEQGRPTGMFALESL